jgi:protein gp37
MNKTSIEWTDYTWNPVTGCNKISQGCKNCYAETMATRFWGDRKFTDVQCHHDRLIEPINMANKLQGKKVFVCDVSDLFHDSVPFEFITSVWAIMLMMPDTVFQILTKRPNRALEFFNWLEVLTHPIKGENLDMRVMKEAKNIWIGTSVENQEQADIRIPLLLQIPAAVRFLSCEPLIGLVDLNNYLPIMEPETGNQINWIIAGGESGHGARPMHPDWVRSLRDQCQSANVPFFFKQWGEYISISQAYDSQIEIKNQKSIQLDNGLFSDRSLVKVGKSKSGNLLDGKQHLAFPA